MSERVLGELVAAETGSRPDLRAFATSRYNNAVKALAGIADRLDATHANNALSHFKKQPLVEENHYRYHDEDVAVVVAKIVLTHAPLAAPRIPHLVSLLGRSQGARDSTTLDAIDKIGHSPTRLPPPSLEQATAGQARRFVRGPQRS